MLLLQTSPANAVNCKLIEIGFRTVLWDKTAVEVKRPVVFHCVYSGFHKCIVYTELLTLLLGLSELQLNTSTCCQASLFTLFTTCKWLRQQVRISPCALSLTGELTQLFPALICGMWTPQRRVGLCHFQTASAVFFGSF